MSLFSLFISWPPPLPPLSSTLSVCISLTLSTTSYITRLHLFSASLVLAVLFQCCCTLGSWRRIKHILFIWGEFLLFCIVSFTVAPPPLLSALPLLLLFISFHAAETMRSNRPDATSCKLSETLWRTLSHSSIQHWKQFGLSYWGQDGVSHFSTRIIVFLLMASAAKVFKMRAGGWRTGQPNSKAPHNCVTHCALSSFPSIFIYTGL